MARRRSGEARREVVVITGASAGVGRAVAHRFARSGAAVALIARDQAALEETKAEVEAEGGHAMVLPLDLADSDAVFAAARDIEEELGPIDVWINNAMATIFSPLSEIRPEEFRRVTETTYLGYVHGTMAALQHMRRRNRGVIVQVGSALSYRGIPLQSAYCGAKHAIRGFTDSLRCELIHERSRIKLTTVHLPAVNTPQFDWARTHLANEPRPVAPVFQPEVAAEAIFDASRNPRREVWLGSSTAQVILGNALAPWLLDRYLARVCYEGQQRQRQLPRGRADNLFHPVHEPHSTHGSFDKEASSSALAFSENTLRIAAAVAGLGAAMIVGVLARGALSARSFPRRR
ncbi:MULTISPECIES: SDR family oxidoreductase [Chelativorans]|jgi:short-subunit dehydrogenase|uniref:Short-chain dehydrogenase/reductase SDR n=1 Tax=Chelativorans sp. (strain BNC1) TaxID=266779 RepID=Q11C22_CHESB|nr:MULTISPECIES: SDR family oxidoreductase [Chelativorans]